MATERQIQEMMARCVATMVYFHNVERTRHTKILMVAEVRSHAASVSEMGLGRSQTVERIVSPVEGELQGRYGIQEGGKLHAQFAEAFFGANQPNTVFTPSKV